MKKIKKLLILCIIVICCYGGYRVTDNLKKVRDLDGTITLTKHHPYGGPFKLDTIKDKTVILKRGERSQKIFILSENERYSFDQEKSLKGHVTAKKLTKDSVTLTGKVTQVREGSYWMMMLLFSTFFLLVVERVHHFVKKIKKQAN